MEAAPASRPWFYPVVEQHDVTYHRVKPLAGHGESWSRSRSWGSSPTKGSRRVWGGSRDRPTQLQGDGPGEPEGAHGDTGPPPAKPQPVPCGNIIPGQQHNCSNHITPCLPWHNLTVWEHQGLFAAGI